MNQQYIGFADSDKFLAAVDPSKPINLTERWPQVWQAGSPLRDLGGPNCAHYEPGVWQRSAVLRTGHA